MTLTLGFAIVGSRADDPLVMIGPPPPSSRRFDRRSAGLVDGRAFNLLEAYIVLARPVLDGACLRAVLATAPARTGRCAEGGRGLRFREVAP